MTPRRRGVQGCERGVYQERVTKFVRLHRDLEGFASHIDEQWLFTGTARNAGGCGE